MRTTRCTLTFAVIIMLALMMASAEANVLTELVFGKHSVEYLPGVTIVLDECVPSPWVNDPALATRYWNGKPIFAGTTVKIGVLIQNGATTGRVFSIWISDPSSTMKFDASKARSDDMQYAGLRMLDKFVGKYGQAELDTSDMKAGTYFVYIAVLRDGKHQPFGEKALAIHIAPPFPDMAKALQNASDKTLDAWGLEATLMDVAPSKDLSPARFDICFSDGGSVKSVRIVSHPTPGRVLGIYQNGRLIGGARVSRVDGDQVYSESSSKFLKQVEGCQSTLTVAWIMKYQVYTTDQVRALSAEEQAFVSACPIVDLREPLRGMLGRNVIHVPYKWRERSRADKDYWAKWAPHWWGIWQAITVDKFTWGLEPIHLPDEVIKRTRVISLAGGIPVVDISEVTRERTDTGGVLSVLGIVKRPDSINNSSQSNSAAAAAADATNITDVDNININENAMQQQ